jgi:PIN domain
MVRVNYVLIDFENVQPESLAALEQDHFKLMMFVGASQTKVPFEAAAALQRMGTRAEYVKISGSGRNALDFHIAFYIGQLAAADPTASFHIVSKDSGFDPLIEHLKTRKVSAGRVADIAGIALLKSTISNSSSPNASTQTSATPKPSPPKSPAPKSQTASRGVVAPSAEERLKVVVSKLRQLKSAKPRTSKTLGSTIASLFQKQLSDAEVAALIESLSARRFLTFSGTKISYSLPNDG